MSTATKHTAPPKFFANEPHLPHLDTRKLIVAAEYLLSGQNPPGDEADYFSAWVNEGAFIKENLARYTFEAVAVGMSDDDLERLETDRALQRQVLEAAIREILECVRVLPSYRNHNLATGTLQLYRRELTWLLGKWMEVSAGGEA